MKTFLIKSESPFLLESMRKELISIGYKDFKEWNESHLPTTNFPIRTLWCRPDVDIQFHAHNCDVPEKLQYNIPAQWEEVLAFAKSNLVKDKPEPSPKPVKSPTVYKAGEIVTVTDWGTSSSIHWQEYSNTYKLREDYINNGTVGFKVELDYAGSTTNGFSANVGIKVRKATKNEKNFYKALTEYPEGTAIKCAVDGEIQIVKSKHEFWTKFGEVTPTGDIITQDKKGDMLWIYDSDTNIWAEKLEKSIPMPFGDKSLIVDLENKVINIPNQGDVSFSELSSFVEYYQNAPQFLGYYMEFENINFGCHEGTWGNLIDIYKLINFV